MLYALVTATLVGLMTGLGVVPFFFRRDIPRRAYDAVLGMGAGLMLSAATLGLLGEALHAIREEGAVQVGGLLLVLVGFASGVVMLVLMERIPHHHAGGHAEHIKHGHHHHGHEHGHEHEHEHEHENAGQVRKGLVIWGAMTIHRIPEGFAIGAGFAAGPARTLGWVLAVAVAFQNACEGAVMAAPLRQAGWSRLRTFAVVSATGFATPLAAAVGFLVGSNSASIMPLFLALASGALIYLISNEIIPETHSHGNEGVATLGLVAGFAVTIVVSSLGHAH